ncbi:unnamed protein product [Arctogadus glacialis]
MALKPAESQKSHASMRTPRAHCTVSQRTWEGVADGWGSSQAEVQITSAPLHTRSDWMTDPLLPKKLNISQLSDGGERSN